MKRSQLHSLSSQTLLFLFLLLAFSLGDETLNSIIKDSAFKAMDLGLTGVEYRVPLPANITGVEASVIRLRGRSFWLKGANLSSFYFPPGILSKPYRSRLLLIGYTLGSNLSISLYGRRVGAGYSLASPVIGLLFYEDSNVSRAGDGKLGLEVTGGSIIIEFPSGDNREVGYCARFGEAGEFSLEGEEVHGRCSTNGSGSFGVVVGGLSVEFPPERAPPAAGDESRWRFWVTVGVGGAGSLVLVCAVGIWVGTLMWRRRERKMRKVADEGEGLEMVWVGGSKMPCAGLMRTVPVLESRSST